MRNAFSDFFSQARVRAVGFTAQFRKRRFCVPGGESAQAAQMHRQEPLSKPICNPDLSGCLTLGTPVLAPPVLRFRLLRPGSRLPPVCPSLCSNSVAVVTMTECKGYRRAPSTPPPQWIRPQGRKNPNRGQPLLLALAVLRPHLHPQLP